MFSNIQIWLQTGKNKMYMLIGLAVVAAYFIYRKLRRKSRFNKMRRA